MVTVNNPTGAVMAIPERTDIVIVRDARLFARRFDSGISDRHCVIIDGPFYPAHGAGCLSAMHFSPTVVNGLPAAGIENMRRGYRMCSTLITHAPFDSTRQHPPLEIGVILPSFLRRSTLLE